MGSEPSQQVASERKFDPRVNDAAAMLFWTHAAQHGFQTTVERTLATRGACLFKQEHAREILEPYGVFQLSKEARESVLEAIYREVADSIEREENLIGIVFAEDAATGRSPSAAAVDTTRVCAGHARISGHEHLERQGELCLRHPLPAVVFSEAQPGTHFIRVASTRRALSCELPLFLLLSGCVQVSPTLFALSGVFYIPVPDARTGDLWGNVIQNSIRSTRQIVVKAAGVLHCIELAWSS